MPEEEEGGEDYDNLVGSPNLAAQFLSESKATGTSQDKAKAFKAYDRAIFQVRSRQFV